MPKKSVIGLVQSESKVGSIVNELHSAGFSTNDVSVLSPDKSAARIAAPEKNSKAPDGAGTSGGNGRTLGHLSGIGTLAIPGVGSFIAAGPILAALKGASAGGISGALIGLGIPEVEAKRYAGKVERGSILLSVPIESSDQVHRAKQILEADGAQDVTAIGESSGATSPSKQRKPADPLRDV